MSRLTHRWIQIRSMQTQHCLRPSESVSHTHTSLLPCSSPCPSDLNEKTLPVWPETASLCLTWIGYCRPPLRRSTTTGRSAHSIAREAHLSLVGSLMAQTQRRDVSVTLAQSNSRTLQTPRSKISPCPTGRGGGGWTSPWGFLHSCSDKCSATFLKILGPGHLRSGHRVRSRNPTSEKNFRIASRPQWWR